MVADCGNGTATRYPGGDPDRARSIALGIDQPFDLVDYGRGIFVTGAARSGIARLNLDGTVAGPPLTGGGLDHPFGIDTDAAGNLRVANGGHQIVAHVGLAAPVLVDAPIERPTPAPAPPPTTPATPVAVDPRFTG